jgi:hypothetical protein
MIASLLYFLFSRDPILTHIQSADLSRAHKTAPMPEETGSGRDVFPGQPSGGYENSSGSGKGGHEPKTTGEKKGTGALPGQ